MNRSSLRMKFWPNKENRTVELEIVVDSVTLSVEMDLDQAREARIDLEDATTIVLEDWGGV